MIAFDYIDLIHRILLRYRTLTAFAFALNIPEQALMEWLRNERSMSLDLIDRMAVLLEIPDAEIERYFFRRVES